jgi:uncharacterized protein (TIGR03790 family)
MAGIAAAIRHALRVVLATLPLLWVQAAAAQGAPQLPPAAGASATPPPTQVPAPTPTLTPPPRQWMPVPRLRGRLTAADIGLVINTADPYSVAVGAHYIRARGLAAAQVLRLELPVRQNLTPVEFEALRAAIENHFGPRTQALALAWAQPYAVACNSLPGALALGFDAALCDNGCARSRSSGWFNSASHRPLQVPGFRPSMLLAAPSVDEAVALIKRGVAADGSLAPGRLGADAAPAQALLLTGPDAARQVRMLLYPPAPFPPGLGVQWREALATEALPGAELLLVAITGSEQVPLHPKPRWLPGGLGDHLTSWGGDLFGSHGQATALAWIASGATASHGAVSEPCNHLQKFPHPQVLIGHYLQGATAIEAYWRSVVWPQQSLFIGEPLSAPFAAGLAAPARP